MGSRLSRQSSLDQDNFSKKRRKLADGAAEGERGGRSGGGGGGGSGGGGGGGGGGGDFLFALMLKSDKLPGVLRRTNHSPYVRRVAWIKEIQKLLRERRIEQAADVLRLLRKVRRKGRQQMDGPVCACVRVRERQNLHNRLDSFNQLVHTDVISGRPN